MQQITISETIVFLRIKSIKKYRTKEDKTQRYYISTQTAAQTLNFSEPIDFIEFSAFMTDSHQMCKGNNA